MLGLFCLIELLILSTRIDAETIYQNSKSVDFVLNPNSISSQAIDIEDIVNEVLRSEDAYLFLSVQSTSPIEISISKCQSFNDALLVSKASILPYFDIVLTEETVQKIEKIMNQKTCRSTTEKNGKGVFLHISTFDQNSFGSIMFSVMRRVQLMKPPLSNGMFEISRNHTYTRSVKLAKLDSLVEVAISNDHPNVSVEVFITFCKDKPGVLYTASHSESFSFLLRSPILENYYDEYSCDGTNQTFFQNSSQPVAPLLIRLQTTNGTTSGTLNVKVDGEVSLHENHVAIYESGTFEIEGNETKKFIASYNPTYEDIHILMEISVGKLEVYLSPCSVIPLDNLYGELGIGSHQIDINIEEFMNNSTCSLEQISPDKVFITVKSMYGLKTVMSFWSPGDGIKWYNIVLIVFLVVVLTVLLFVIIYFGRRKTGQLNISPLLHSFKSTKY